MVEIRQGEREVLSVETYRRQPDLETSASGEGERGDSLGEEGHPAQKEAPKGVGW